MSDSTGQRQVHQMAPAASSRPAREVLSDDQLKYVDGWQAGSAKAAQDPTLNGEDSRRRYLEGTT
jgi:hypothetical protein